MNITIPLPRFLQPLLQRDNGGNYSYLPDNLGKFGWEGTNLRLAQCHPILTPAMLFVAKLYSQAQIKVVREDTGEEVKDHWLTKLLDSPNMYQTNSDFLEEQMFTQIAQGQAICYIKKKYQGSNEITDLYFLDRDLIEFPAGFITPLSKRKNSDKILNQEIIYNKKDELIRIKIKDLLFFYDMPNSLNSDNAFETVSRLDGLRQVLINSIDSQEAKNIILKSNGKEMLTTKGTDGFTLDKTEKEKAQNMFNTSYGLGNSRSRSLITKASLEWTSMHIALRDLGLDESTKVDGNIIYTALHIPKDIISLEAKKTTYNNFKESMASYVQNELTPSLTSTLKVFQKLLENEPGLKLVGSYDHLPIMQFIMKERYEVVSLQAKALSDLLLVGIPDEIALGLCGFDNNLTLNKPKPESDGEQEGSSEDEQEGSDEN